MYQYYEELENPNDFKLYFAKEEPFSLHALEKPSLTVEFYQQFQDLFSKLRYIHSLMLPNITTEQSNRFFREHGEFLIDPRDDENYIFVQELLYKINLDIYDIHTILSFYLNYISFYQFVFPELKSFFSDVAQQINKALQAMKMKKDILIPNPKADGVVTFPNAWFITPKGYLYNTGGADGHKEGNLIYSYDDICASLDPERPVSELVRLPRRKDGFKEKRTLASPKVPHVDCAEQIQAILKNGLVNIDDFSNYSNLAYRIDGLFTSNGVNNVSYQQNIRTLVVGYLSAKEALYQAYERLNGSTKIRDMVKKVGKLSHGIMTDMLVRFAGFSKVESTVERTITTSAIDGIERFRAYLDRGWNLVIIPGIVYDAYLDDVNLANFDSYYIQKYFDQVLSEYKGKGKVLIFSSKT